MKIDQLRNVLGRFADLHEHNTSAEAGKNLRLLADALSGHDKKTVKAFVKSTLERRRKSLQK